MKVRISTTLIAASSEILWAAYTKRGSLKSQIIESSSYYLILTSSCLDPLKFFLEYWTKAAASLLIQDGIKSSPNDTLFINIGLWEPI